MSLDGEMHQLTDGSSTAAFPSITADGHSVVFTDYRNIAHLHQWHDGKMTALLADNSDNSDARLSPVGDRMVYNSDRSGGVALWISDRNGQSPRQLVPHTVLAGRYARWSPDNRTVAFECRVDGRGKICTIAADGSDLQHITRGSGDDVLPSFSEDGRSLYFGSNRSGTWQSTASCSRTQLPPSRSLTMEACGQWSRWTARRSSLTEELGKEGFLRCRCTEAPPKLRRPKLQR